MEKIDKTDKTWQDHEVNEKLIKEWSEQQIKYRKLPYGLIGLYQFYLPILILYLPNYLIFLLHKNFLPSMLSIILLLPLYFLMNYFLFIFIMIKLSQILNGVYEKKSPSNQGTFSRKFSKHRSGMESEELRYYHLRGFVHKFPAFISKKSPFPGLINYCLRKVGNNIIHKNSYYGDCFVGLEMTEIEANTIILDGTCVSSHVVDSIFGNLSIFKVKFKENVVVYPNCAIAPGVSLSNDVIIAPKSFCVKKWSSGSKSKYFLGAPPKPSDIFSFEKYLPQGFLDKTNESISNTK